MFEDSPYILICSPTVIPTVLVEKVNEAFCLWAFGPQYFNIRHSTEKMVNAWNELHGERWILTQEETPENNVKIMGLLWEEELITMLDQHFYPNQD